MVMKSVKLAQNTQKYLSGRKDMTSLVISTPIKTNYASPWTNLINLGFLYP